ncbi:MAG: hypothetical protein AAGB34_06370, partial [Planctomycetota bacterium]
PVYDRYGTVGKGEHASSSTTTTTNGNTVQQTRTEPSEAGTGNKYLDHAYSVIAKIASDVGGGANASAQTGQDDGPNTSAGVEGHLNNAQWFATGKAADILASHPAIAGAVVGSPGVAQAAVNAQGLAAFTGISETFIVASLKIVYDVMRMQSDAHAVQIYRDMDSAAVGVGTLKLAGVKLYIQDGTGDLVEDTTRVAMPGTAPFRELALAHTQIIDSIDAIDAELAENPPQFAAAAGGTPTQITGTAMTDLLAERDAAKDESERIRRALSEHKDMKRALQRFAEYVTAGKGS